MNPISVITTVIGIVSCIVGVASYVSAQLTKAKQDGVLIEKVNQCVKNTEEIRNDIKEKNKELDKVIDEHTRAITKLQAEMVTVFKHLNLEN